MNGASTASSSHTARSQKVRCDAMQNAIDGRSAGPNLSTGGPSHTSRFIHNQLRYAAFSHGSSKQ